MMKIKIASMIVIVAAFLIGCASIDSRATALKKGMTVTEVERQMGERYIVRAARLHDDGLITEVWEYRPRFTLRKSDRLLIYFENGAVVSWGSREKLSNTTGF